MPAEVESMMYVGEVPWHGIGVQLPDVATAEEAIHAAGLDWKVEKHPLYRIFDNTTIRIPDRYAIVRATDGAYLGVVGDVYTPLQNTEAFSFFDAVVQSSEAKYVTAGSLRGGRRIWILSKIPGDVVVGDGDEVNKYLLLFNTHDGTSPVRMMVTPIRVVCNNTLNVALAGTTAYSVRIRHCSTMAMKIEEARQSLKIVNAFYEKFEDTANVLAHTKVTDDIMLGEYFDRIGLTVPTDRNPDDVLELRSTLTRLFDGEGKGMDLNRHSLWNAFNVIAEYVDHNRGTRKTDVFSSSKESRLDSLWFGSGAMMKRRAWDAALSMAAAS